MVALTFNKGRHNLIPPSEVVKIHNDVVVDIQWSRFTLREIDTPFGKGDDNNHKIKGSKMSMHLIGEYLTRMIPIDQSHITFEDRQPKVPDM